MQRIPKITPSDYPDLLAAADEGISERELARRYDCAPSLVHRHLVRAKRARELADHEEEPDSERIVEPIEGSVRDIVEARIRDPHTSARDLASLMNQLSKLDAEEASAADDELRLQLVAARQRVRELERANFRQASSGTICSRARYFALRFAFRRPLRADGHSRSGSRACGMAELEVRATC